MQEKLLLLGFGDIAQRLAHQLNTKCYQITAVKRKPIAYQAVDVMLADCTDNNDMNALFSQTFNVVVMTFTPNEISDEGYRRAYIDTTQTIISAIKKQTYQPRLIILVSSTSVYGQQGGDIVNENSPTEPSSFSGKRLLEAEKLLAASNLPYCCVRFSGIYGPGRRRLIDQVIAGKGSPKEPVLYSNRIHADDCAGVLHYLIEQQKNNAIDSLYLATDCEPVPLYDVKQWLAQKLQLTPGFLKTDGEKPQRMFRSSKRCSNQKLLKTGYKFLYPSYKEGYSHLLENHHDND